MSRCSRQRQTDTAEALKEEEVEITEGAVHSEAKEGELGEGGGEEGDSGPEQEGEVEVEATVKDKTTAGESCSHSCNVLLVNNNNWLGTCKF